MKKRIPNIHVVIPAAGTAKNKVMLHSQMPDAMTPINGKPVIGYILDDLLDRHVPSATIVLNETDTYTEKYVMRRYAEKIDLRCIRNTELGRGPGYSVLLGCKDAAAGVLVYLGDTIYKGNLSFTRDFLITAPFTETPSQWCFVQKKNGALQFINKPEGRSGSSGSILTGVYFFSNGTHLEKCAQSIAKRLTCFEISDILTEYQKQHTFQLVNAAGWYDCGNLENYYRAKVDFLKLRNFNQIRYDNLRGCITKLSDSKKDKIRDEISWYRMLPRSLQIFTPRLVDHNNAIDNPWYTIEFYGYQSLADLFVFESIDISAWDAMITRLFDVLHEFEKEGSGCKISRTQYYKMLYGKLSTRSKSMEGQDWYDDVSSRENIMVNGELLHNLPHFSEHLRRFTDTMFESSRCGILHGDLCLSNILYDPGNRIFKFIDPRGSFGKRSIFGDIRYDVAKLRHSFVGGYDFILADLFRVAENGGEYDFKLYTEAYNTQVAALFDQEVERRGFDLNEIKVVEALLFLSMIPLHSENKQRQKAMYLTGVALLNEVFA